MNEHVLKVSHGWVHDGVRCGCVVKKKRMIIYKGWRSYMCCIYWCCLWY